MTIALVFATEGIDPSGSGPARALLPLGDQSVIDQLCAQLQALGVTDLRVVCRSGSADALRSRGLAVTVSPDVTADLALVAQVSRHSAEPVIITAGDLVAHEAALASGLAPVGPATVALLGGRGADVVHPLVLCQRDRVISVGSTWHDVTAPNARFRGLLKVDVADLDALAQACDRLLEFGHDGPRTVDDLSGQSGVTGLLLLALVRAGLPVTGYRIRRLLCRRVTDAASAAEAEAALAAIDEDAVRLKLAVKEHDDLFATFCVSTYSPRVVRLAAKLGLSPTAVTWISIAFAVVAATVFAIATTPLVMLAGSVLLYLGFLFDCVDGQLARYLHHYSRYGGWLDMVADRGKEYLVYAGLAIGAVHQGSNAWPYAVGVMLLQTVRHMTDTWYGALHESAVGRLPTVPLTSRVDALGRTDRTGESLPRRVGHALGRVSATMQSHRGSVPYWFKRTIVFPIGERWLLIMVAAPLIGPRDTLICMLAWGTLAAGYTLSGRVLRSRAMQIPAFADHDVHTHRDDGQFARRLGRRWEPLPMAVGAALFGGALFLASSNVLGRVFIDATQEWVVLVALAGLLLVTLSARHPHDGALDWLVAAALRAAEYAFILIVGINDAVPLPVVFVLLGVLALYHYDLAGRLDKRASPLSVRRLALGWDGRALVLGAAAVFDAAEYAFVVLSGFLALVFVVGALVGTYSHQAARSRPPASTQVASSPGRRDSSVADAPQGV